MYYLTLTREERRTLDWAEGRYEYGEIGRILRMDCDQQCDGEEHADWDADCPITWNISEHHAWEMQEWTNQDDVPFPCATNSLVNKLQTLFDKIV